MKEIKSERLYHAFMMGAKEVMTSRLLLNQINVFPVPDGDTGNNLNNMMQSIVMYSEEKGSVKETLDSIANSAIIGARGNSGVIFSQYIHGLSLIESHPEMVTLEYFISATHKAYVCAYDAVDTPVEGTMLTSMRVFHEALKYYKQTKTTFMEVLDSAYIKVEESVQETTNQLRKLKEAAVVDSGAKGFALFIKGFICGLKGNTDMPHQGFQPLSIGATHPFEHDQLTAPPTYRYCTEALLKTRNEGQLQVTLKAQLKDLGDSLVVSQGKVMTRLHIHTNDPSAVFKLLATDYRILDQKVDDMKVQYEMLHNRQYKTVLVTDSSADIPKDLLDSGQVVVFPLEIIIGEGSYRDKLTLHNDLLFQLASEDGIHPTSSQPSLVEVEKKMADLLVHYDSAVVITVSKALSGTYSVFSKVAQTYGERMQVIDSKQNSIAQGLLVAKALELLAEGMGPEAIREEIQAQVSKSKILVSVASLKSMIASGRLNVRMGRIATFLGIYPLITLDKEGRGAVEKVFWGSKTKLRKLARYMNQVNRKQPIERFAVTYVNDRNKAEKFAIQLEEILGIKCSFVVECSSVIAAGAGRDALAVAYIRK